MIEVLTREFGGGALARAALAKYVPAEWYEAVPTTPDGWKSAAQQVATEFAEHDWLEKLAPAFGLNVGAAPTSASERLARSAQGRGVVITTGQQPALFGGPMYTWSKALSALALADTIERETGIPAAPVFWAATDDADYAEASYTAVVQNGDVHVLRMPDRENGASMAHTPLGDVSDQFDMLAHAAGSALDLTPLQTVRESYASTETVGSAYLKLLRALMEPLGISVLDAAHPSVRTAASPLVQRALQRATDVRDALADRSKAIESVGEYRLQVQPVPNLSLVFNSEDGVRKRVQIKEATRTAANVPTEHLSPNVLLRPVVERGILPTVTYVAGPAEYAYFAQVTAVADALQVARPRVVPRWSGLILEPHVREILQELNATVDDFQDPHAIEGRVAREELSEGTRTAIANLRTTLETQAATLRKEQTSLPALQKVVCGFEAQVEHRIARLERRFAAAVKRAGTARLHDVAVARASLFPNGTPQERLLNILPFLARYGDILQTRMIEAASRHARLLVTGD